MAYAISATHGLSHVIADALYSAFDTVTTAVKNRVDYNKMVRELEALGPRELDDIGIAPWQIHEIARNSVYGR
ncbi:DUF1127 domain-containing protein [Aliiroseovarius sp.]|uniref:DUF1127 domain-containing protein n=1 Tax=Aliiroseovarius sp. TaxID=1872442 RepID=UPI002635EEE2|nr:DUF1127 domain-containing protein [Aliiroseovarius sp.]